MTGPMKSERGSGTVQALSIFALMVVLVGVAIQITVVVGLRQSAGAAADLAALAASQATAAGRDGCAAAREIAMSNGAAVTSCQLDAAVATVTVRITGPRWWGSRWGFEQRARAAPASYLP